MLMFCALASVFLKIVSLDTIMVQRLVEWHENGWQNKYDLSLSDG